MDISESEKSEIMSEINYLKRKAKILEQMLMPDQRPLLMVDETNNGTQYSSIEVKRINKDTVGLNVKKRSIC